MALPQSHGKGADAPVSPQDIWDALRAQGATPVQAAAIMGNQIAESSLNPEASVIDSNGARSVGLNQWNADSYPSSGSLVTGHPLADMLAQVKFLASTGGFAAAKGSTVAAAASAFAANYERCASCQPGGASNTARQANATQVAGWASSGGWPQSAGGATDTATLTTAETSQQSATCAWYLGATSGLSLFGLNVGDGGVGVCVISKSQLRALQSVTLILGGGAVVLYGLALIASESRAGQRAEQAGKRAALAGLRA